MSYYYAYRIGYLDEDGKAHPFMPFTVNHDWVDIINRSRSYASDLHEIFIPISEEMVSDDLKLYIAADYDERNENDKRAARQYVRWCYLKDLPSGDYIKRGYFLIEDVMRYNADPDRDCVDYFFDVLSPAEYATRLENYMKFGDDEKKDEDGGIIRHSIKDYMYYAYPDYSSAEYEASQIRDVANSYCFNCFCDNPSKENSLIVFDFEG